MGKQLSGMAGLVAVSLLAGCIGGGSSSSDDDGITSVAVPAIEPVAFSSIDDVALYVAVTSRLLGGGSFVENEQPPSFDGPTGTMDCVDGGTRTIVTGNRTLSTPFGDGNFEFQQVAADACKESMGSFSSMTDGLLDVGFGSEIGSTDHSVEYAFQGDLDAEIPLVTVGAEESANLTERFLCWDCEGTGDTYKTVQYSETYVNDGQYAYRFQFGADRDTPVEWTETVIEYRDDYDDDYVFDFDITGVVGMNSSVCTLGSAEWETDETLRIVDFSTTDAAGEDYVENRIEAGKVTINGEAEVVFHQDGATIEWGGASVTFNEQEFVAAGMPCYD